MTDIGHYKTNNSKTYHFHFDPQGQTAFALGPLPDLIRNHEVAAQDENEAAEKLSQKVGLGVFATCYTKNMNT